MSIIANDQFHLERLNSMLEDKGVMGTNKVGIPGPLAFNYENDNFYDTADYATADIGGNPGSSVVNAIAKVSNLVQDTSKYGDGFGQVYSEVSGGNLTGDISNFYKIATNPNTPSNEVFKVCEGLSENLRKALEKAHMSIPEVPIPKTCQTGVISECSDVNVEAWHKKVQTLQKEYDDLVCQAAGKLEEKLAIGKVITDCTRKLDERNEQCKANSVTNTTSTCPFQNTAVGKQVQVDLVATPSAAVPADGSSCSSCSKKKNTKPKARKRRTTVKPKMQSYDGEDYYFGPVYQNAPYPYY